MNILMMTNTYSPHVGGVAHSIERFARRYRYLGHHVKVVSPEFDGMDEAEPDVIRIPALRHFNHTDFSMALPIPHRLQAAVERFEPDVIHSHHPFLVGGIALRLAHSNDLPLVFTHHTRYEDYTHNVPGDSALLKRFVINLATNYANLCDQVFAPSDSIAELLGERGVRTPVSVVPTGVEMSRFSHGDGEQFRKVHSIPADATLIGHLGRISEEKNIPFLVDGIIDCLQHVETRRDVHCMIAGVGPLTDTIERLFRDAGLSSQLHMVGIVNDGDLTDAYHAMDVFAFASTSETQGMVITEAMASGVPVVAIDAPGVREVVDEVRNGRLVMRADRDEFSAALQYMINIDSSELDRLSRGAQRTAQKFSMEKTANTALELYSRLRNYNVAHRHPDYPAWVDALHVLGSEWELLKSAVDAAADAFEHR